MQRSTIVKGLLAMLAGFALATAAAAQAPAGQGELSGKAKIKAKGCGKDSGDALVFFAMASDGDWVAEDDLNDYSGTSAPVKSGERKRDLTFDTESLDALEAQVNADASALCATEFAGSVTVNKARAKVNKKETKAKLKLNASVTDGSDEATARVKAKGDWGPLAG